ncbi:hypothetical protein OAX78_04765 [Planctomycetota bacterium]|nr:hypothetical protein [Planctomycetota bacterium]
MTDEQAVAAPTGYGTRRQIVIKTIVGLVGLIAFSALLGQFVREPLEAAGQAFVSNFGHVGVLVGVLLIDTSPVPLITEPLLYACRRGPWPWPPPWGRSWRQVSATRWVG